MTEKISDLDLEKVKNAQLQIELLNAKYQNIIMDLYLRYKLSVDDKFDLASGKIERKETLQLIQEG